MEGFHLQGVLVPPTLPGKVAPGGGSKPPACREDNVLGGHAAEATSFVPARRQDYRKVFGAASACSIPVLDLPPPGDSAHGVLGCSALDYLDIFGGFDGRDFAVPYEELFFDASQESGSVGAAPGPPSAPHNPATPSATSCRAKGLVETSCLKQGTPASEWSGEDYIGSSSSSVNYDLSDGAKQTNTAYHSASWSSKDDPVNATMHKNQVHTILGSTFVVENAKTSKFNTQVATDVCFYSSGCEETTKGHHPKKAVPSTSFSSNMNHPQNDKKAEPRPSKLESSVSWSSVNEQKESFMLSSWSTVSRSNSVSAKLSNKQSVHEDFAEKKTKGEWQNNNVRSTVIGMRSGNDLKVRYIASEDVPANEALFSCSSSDHAASSSSESFPSHLTTNINFDAVDVRVAEANHLKKSMSHSTSCTSSQSSDYDNKAEVKQFNCMSKFLENSPVRRSHRSHISSGHSTSSWDQSYPDPAFLEVSNIILRTQPSQGPPPSRPPPSRPASCSDFDACRPSADCHNCGIATGPTVKSHSFKQPVRDISPPLFDAGVDEGSAALASVTAIKEAMELAQARLKSAKLSMERKDNLQIGIKSGANNGQGIERDEDKANGELIFQQAQESSDGKSNVFDMEKMMREFRVSRQAADFKDKERNCRSLQQSLQELQLEEVSENALGHEETENKMSLKVQEGVNNLKVWGWSFDQDEDEKELEVTHALGVSAEGIHLMISKKNQEDNNVKCIMTDGSACFHDGNEMKPDETGSLFDQYKRKNSNITQQTFEQAENENVLKAAHEVHDHKGNSAKLNEVKESDGCSGNEKKLKEVQKLPLSSEKEHAQPSIPPVSGIPDDADYSIMADGGNNQKKINENIKEIKVVLDRRQAILLGKQCHTCKGTEIEEEKDRRRRNLEEVEEMERTLEEEIERDRMFQDEKDEKMKYEGDQKEKRYEVEERGRRKTVEEREKIELDEKQERVNLEKEEMKRRKLENKERKKMKLEEEERERKKLEEKEGGRRKLKEERDWRLEEAERERRKSEEKERERRRIEEDDGDTKLEGEKDREMRVEEEERKINLEEKERSRRRIEQKEREDGQMEQEREIEKRMMEAEKELKRVEPEEEKDKECEREKDRQAVEGEAHERVFVEAQERAERVALETVTAESQQRVQAEAQEERARIPAENLEKSLAEKASTVVRSQAEHAVVEKEMAETWEYAVETTHDTRECAANFVPTSTDGLKRSGDLSDMWDPHLQFQTLDASGSSHQLFSEAFHASGEKFGGSEDESFIRCKARRERLQRTVERMGKALAEKNMRDTIAQREQAERHRLAETLDADVRRWSNGKEGNLRALLSTLQYILGPESGWQPIPLTEVITAPAVKKAYRKAMLCVHPDKLQQWSASIQQKYICEKVFDLLKEAWNRFNSEER